jgi:hypothetical protein
MSINKSFVIKNGLEVSTDLILADADTNKVGIGTTAPQYTLHVNGGIGATDLYVSGIGTFVSELNVGLDGTVLTVLGVGNSIGIGTALPAFLLDVRAPVSTGQTALYVQGDVRITGDLVVEDDLTLDEVTVRNITVTEALNVTSPGISTFGGYVDINDSVDISSNLNVVGLSTLGGYVDINANADFSGTINVVGLTTLGGYVDINNSVDISGALNVVGLTTLGGYVDINNSVDISGALNVVGLTTLGGYVDINNSVDISGALNVSGIATIASVSIVGAALSNLIVSGIATIATVDINGGDIEVSNVDTVDLNVTGISTLGTVRISSGIITASSGIVTYFGDGSNLIGLAGDPPLQTVLNTGNTSTIGMSISGVTTLTTLNSTSGTITNLTGTNINVSGIITASAFFGDGSGLTGLTGAGSTVFNDTTTNQEFFPLFTDITTGTITASGISTSKLTYNPSTGAVTAVDFNSTSDINLKENIHTVGNALEITEQLRGVSFDWKETGKSSYGVIAQELEEVLPELVKQGEIKSVNYNGIIGVLIEAVKELKREVEDLKRTK